MFIQKRMLHELKCTCTLSFYGRLGYNKRNIVAYAKCAYATHDASFKFIFGHLRESVSYLMVKSTSEKKVVHEQPVHATIYGKLKGKVRLQWGKELQHRGVQKFLDDMILRSDEGIINDGHMQDIQPASVLYKVVSEVKCAARLRLESLDLLDLFQKYTEDKKLLDPFFKASRSTSTCNYVSRKRIVYSS